MLGMTTHYTAFSSLPAKPFSQEAVGPFSLTIVESKKFCALEFSRIEHVVTLKTDFAAAAQEIAQLARHEKTATLDSVVKSLAYDCMQPQFAEADDRLFNDFIANSTLINCRFRHRYGDSNFNNLNQAIEHLYATPYSAINLAIKSL